VWLAAKLMAPSADDWIKLSRKELLLAKFVDSNWLLVSQLVEQAPSPELVLTKCLGI
jgi:hypothetical protein